MILDSFSNINSSFNTNQSVAWIPQWQELWCQILPLLCSL